MQPFSQTELKAMVAGFAVEGQIGTLEPLGQGLINLSYRVRVGDRDWVLQRINGRVFPHPERIMSNLQLLMERSAEAGRLGLKLPGLALGRDGAPFVRATDGALWRLMELIPEAVGLTRLETPEQAREVGAVLGRFHRLAADLPRDRLQMSLPGFHHTPSYLARHLSVRESATAANGEEGPVLAECFARIDARLGLAKMLEDARSAGLIGERVIHGDPKLDNILFDETGRRALALIDLDTVQPGLIQQDLGDCLRSCCNRSGESPQDRGNARFDLELCAAILGAYGEETRGLLGPGDVEVLYDSIRLLPFELALRFLTDHLEGDRYFRVAYRGQNLEKARTQLDLVEDIEAQEPAIRQMILVAFGFTPFP